MLKAPIERPKRRSKPITRTTMNFSRYGVSMVSIAYFSINSIAIYFRKFSILFFIKQKTATLTIQTTQRAFQFNNFMKMNLRFDRFCAFNISNILINTTERFVINLNKDGFDTKSSFFLFLDQTAFNGNCLGICIYNILLEAKFLHFLLFSKCR